ncbi:MAG: alpha/beta hydrolase [Gemmatimonadaceae bacterium]
MVFNGESAGAYTIRSDIVAESLRREVHFPSGGETLYGYWLRQPGGAPRVTIVFSHGKDGDLSRDAKWAHAEALWQCGVDVLTYDYRGFGRSTGTSKDASTLATDASAALTYALTQPGVTEQRVVSYAHSLGSVPGISMAVSAPNLRALVVESGFSNGQAMANTANPLGMPVTWLLKDPMQNTRKIASVAMPVLIIHGTSDAQIPVEQGRALYAAAPQPKQLLIVNGATHADIPSVLGIPQFCSTVRAFIHADSP